MDLRREAERTGARRLYALVRGLSSDAALWRALRPPQTTGEPGAVETTDPEGIRNRLKEWGVIG